jgi:MipA family protein
MRIFVPRTMARRLAIAVAGQLLISTPAQADDPAATHAANYLRDQVTYVPGWDVALGGGPEVRPTYEGSDRYRHVPGLILNVNWTWADVISIGTKEISASWHEEGCRVGVALAYDTGRRDNTGDGAFQEGDDRLKGLGDIGFAVGPKLFASYSVGQVTFSESVTRFTSGTNGGLRADVGVSWRRTLTERSILMLHAGASWQDRKRMQEFFGVTPTQALNSMFPQFTAHAGVKDVSGGATYVYRFGEHLFLLGSANVEQLLNDAAGSPVTFASKGVTARFGVGYHF